MDIQFVFLIHLAATLFMLGLIWMVQVVHYPLYDGIDAVCFAAYEKRHCNLITWLVAPGMGIEGLTGVWLLMEGLPRVPAWVWWVGVALIGVNALSTAVFQVPQHNRLVNGYDASCHRFLTKSNWIRTAAWTARSVLLLWALRQTL